VADESADALVLCHGDPQDVRISHSVIPEHFGEEDEEEAGAAGDGEGSEPRAAQGGGTHVAGFMGS
jgi:hypothetical protein